MVFIFLNLFIAIILEGFSSSGEDDDNRIEEDSFSSFKRIWIKYDPLGEGFINVYQFDEFLLDLVEEELR